jgi:hypothetical protein
MWVPRRSAFTCSAIDTPPKIATTRAPTLAP